MSKTAKKQKVSKVTSAKELKSWLRGAMEFQPSDWTPNAEQWAAIRDRIFNLEEVSAHETVQHVHYNPEPAFAPVSAFGPVAAPTPAYTPVSTVAQSALGGVPDSGRLAVNHSPTDSGVVPVSSQNTVLEGEYKSPF
jgi:hypothetical protein